MEADWSVELAAEDPIIAVPWAAEEILETLPNRVARFIDLRGNQKSQDELLNEIEEARDRPALRTALATLNRTGSQFWTTKCDAWETGPGSEAGGSSAVGAEIDPWEMDAGEEDAVFSAGCYIDLFLRDSETRRSFETQEHWIQRLSKKMRGIPLRCARIDFVLRHAEVEGTSGYGLTWFVESCGATAELARERWTEALALSLPVLMEEGLLYGNP